MTDEGGEDKEIRLLGEDDVSNALALLPGEGEGVCERECERGSGERVGQT